MKARPRRPLLAFAIAAVALAVLWALFSEKFDPVHLSLGALSLGITLWLSRSLLRAPDLPWEERWPRRVHWGRLAVYPVWLLWEILKANVDMAKLILGPQRRIDPVLLRFETRLKGALARVALGNSITLTPGTFTLEVEGRTVRVHAITEDAARSPVITQMEDRLARAFGATAEMPEAPLLVTRTIDDPRFGGGREVAPR